MFAIAAILILLGMWSLFICLMDWDTSLVGLDLQTLAELLGHETARWVVGAAGAALLLAGLLVTF